MVKAPSEVDAAITLRVSRYHGEGLPERHLTLLAAVATLQSTGHLLVIQPLPSCKSMAFFFFSL